MSEEIHGTIEGWCFVGQRVSGRIYGVTKGRFSDGDGVTTSTVVRGPDGNGIISTRNSMYRLGVPRWIEKETTS